MLVKPNKRIESARMVRPTRQSLLAFAQVAHSRRSARKYERD